MAVIQTAKLYCFGSCYILNSFKFQVVGFPLSDFFSGREGKCADAILYPCIVVCMEEMWQMVKAIFLNETCFPPS